MKWSRDQALTSVLWGAVAAVGQFTMLFQAIIGRIHVAFVDEAPVFSVDPRGPITLTKDTALTSVWVGTIAYGLLVIAVVYLRPRLSNGMRLMAALAAAALAVLAALAEPWWGLIILADFVALYLVLRTPGPSADPAQSTDR